MSTKYSELITKKQQEALSKNNMAEAQRLLKLQKTVAEDEKKGIVVQSMEKAMIDKDSVVGDIQLKKIIDRLNAPKNKKLSENKKLYTDYTGNSSFTNDDLMFGVIENGSRITVHVVDQLDDIHEAFKKRQTPKLTSADDKSLTAQNVKDIRDFAKKALLPYVTAFFRAFELTDAKIHAIIDQDSGHTNYLDKPVLPVDASERLTFVAKTSSVIPAFATLATSLGPSDELGIFNTNVMEPLVGFARAGPGSAVLSVPSMIGGKRRKSSKRKSSKRKLSGGKKRKSSKRRSGRKLVGGNDMETMEGGAKRRKSSKRRSGRKLVGGNEMETMEGGKRRKSSKRSSGKRKMTDDMVGGKKRKSSKKTSGKRKMTDDMVGGKKRKSSKKTSGKRKLSGGKKRKSSKRRSGKKH